MSMITELSFVVSMSSTSESRKDGVPTAHCVMYIAYIGSGVGKCLTSPAGDEKRISGVVEGFRTNETCGDAETATPPTAAAKTRPPAVHQCLDFFMTASEPRTAFYGRVSTFAR